MSWWPLTLAQTFALWGLVQLVCAIVFAEMCQCEIDESLDRGADRLRQEVDDAA